ncbi:hypothetical protein RRG08_011895 [Elysia crispata]|uniref:Uncharacterized protein n=1 Tax=Elysia crispata TaxID=231223 RepID=A0AAE0ZMN3_9GAST|nr:hypothetical protein RRG08_011895 [Elysia crispata]
MDGNQHVEQRGMRRRGIKFITESEADQTHKRHMNIPVEARLKQHNLPNTRTWSSPEKPPGTRKAIN